MSGWCSLQPQSKFSSCQQWRASTKTISLSPALGIPTGYLRTLTKCSLRIFGWYYSLTSGLKESSHYRRTESDWGLVTGWWNSSTPPGSRSVGDSVGDNTLYETYCAETNFPSPLNPYLAILPVMNVWRSLLYTLWCKFWRVTTTPTLAFRKSK
jgi:hypothetical protein